MIKNIDSMRAALIGCGQIAGRYDETSRDDGIYSHAGAYRTCGIKMEAAFDTDFERLEKFSRHWNISRPCRTLEELLQVNYDIVSVCTPDTTHYSVIKTILSSAYPPKIIWAEKPLAMNAAEAKELVDLAQAVGTGMRVSYQRRWDPGHQKIKAWLQDGGLGIPLTAAGYYVKGLIHIGTTVVDTLRFLLGEVSESFLISSQRGSYPGDLSSSLFLKFPSGCEAVIQGVDGPQYTYSLFEIDILGTQGRIRILDNGDTAEIYEVVECKHYPGFCELKKNQTWKTQMSYAMKYGLEAMIKDLQEGKGQDVSQARNAVRNLQVIAEAASISPSEVFKS